MLMQNSEGIELFAPAITADYAQVDSVCEVLCENRGRWMTLDQIAAFSGIESRSSIRSRIADLRIFGLTISKRRHPVAGGKTRIFEYRLV